VEAAGVLQVGRIQGQTSRITGMISGRR